MDTKLAIVIPYYKIDFFEETLTSLANQTNKQFKVYIGIDASNIDPLHILENYKSKIDYHYKHFKNNLGATSLTKQWERCLSMVEHEEWIMILGDDDMLGKNLVQSFYDNLSSFVDKSNVIRFSSITIFEDSNTQSTLFKQPIWESAYNSYYRRITGLNRSTLSEYIFKKEKYQKYGFADYPLAWHSDDRAWIDFSEDKPIYSINNAQAYIRMSSVNISGKNDNLESKKQSTLLFYAYLMQQKRYGFNKEQRRKIVANYAKSLHKASGFHAKHFFYLLQYYIKQCNIIAILRLLK